MKKIKTTTYSLWSMAFLFLLLASNGNAQTPSLSEHKCASADDNTNWQMSRSYDYDGNVIGAEIQFSDQRGRPMQSQVWDAIHDEVYASQPLYDKYGRAVIQTMGAPITGDKFCYKNNFVQTAGETVYAAVNFEGNKLNNPDPVGNGQKGTLG